MRFVPVASLLAAAFLLSAMPSSAQSMAELAAREKERRSKAKNAGKAYTESDLGKGGTSAPAAAAPTSAAPAAADSKATTAAEAAKPAGDAAQKEKTDDELKAERERVWRDKLTQANAEITRLQSRADDLQRALNDLSQNLYGSTRARQASELEQVQQALAASRKSLEDLQEEGRRSGYR
jgi:hypothetical protein